MSPKPTGYEYDVFFSYKQSPETNEWSRRVCEMLRRYLAEELNNPSASVFRDRDDLDASDRWPDRLAHAISVSKCLVCLWSPGYFQSDWCNKEWRSFLARERALAMDSGKGLIVPLNCHDGQHFPEEARKVQWTDVSDYWLGLPAFWETARAVELEKIVKGFSGSVADAVRRAPPYRADWGIVEPAIDPAPVHHIQLPKL